MADTSHPPIAAGNLLTEPVFCVRVGAGTQQQTLPGVLHALATADVEAFTGLRRHQRQAWHSFLVQVGVIAAEQQGWSGAQALAVDEDGWQAALRALTAGRDEPWTLVVPDLAQPAFLQPPVPEASLSDWSAVVTADGVDLLVTAKKHDVKGATVLAAAPAQWAWALLASQTGDGYGGRDLHGIARMNGGLGNRPSISHAPRAPWSQRFRRDVATLVAQLGAMRNLGPASGDRALLWLSPWNGGSSEDVASCHPLFVEVCRRIRLSGSLGRIQAWTRPTKAPRLDAKGLKGHVGDPWTPIDKKEAKSLTLAKTGFSYDKVVDLLFSGSYEHGAAFAWRKGDEGILLQAMTRGQGKTEGLHERWLAVPPRVLSQRGDERARQKLDQLAQERAQDAGAVWKPLRQAVQLLQQGAPPKPDWQSKAADPWRVRLNRRIDEAFFPRLWAAAEAEPTHAQEAWRGWLLGQARAVLDEAIAATPLPGVRRYRAIAAAEARLTTWPKGK